MTSVGDKVIVNVLRTRGINDDDDYSTKLCA
jgi:hypothetical protein